MLNQYYMGDMVLVVDDEEDLCRLLKFHLDNAGFDVQTVNTASDALLAAGRTSPAVAILDVMLPDMSGVEVCRRLRADDDLREMGILMLTAMGSSDDRVEGLEAGADDYVVKPFDVREVILRTQALCRRISEKNDAKEGSQKGSGGTELVWQDLRIDPRSHDAFIGDTPLSLRPLEFKLLVTLMSDPGKVFSRKELLAQVWDMPHGGNPRTVDVHVRRLRQNLGSSAGVVETVPGFGYRAKT